MFGRRQSKKVPILWGFIGIIFCITLLSVTVTPSQDRSARWYESVFFTILSPFQRAITGGTSTVQHAFSKYLSLVNIAENNSQLAAHNRELDEQLLLFQDLTEENRRLRYLLALKEKSPWEAVAAQVIAHNPQAEFSMLTINRGEKDGLTKRMPVVTSQGLVGQIYRVGPHAAQVLLLTDPTSSVDGRIEASGARGLIVGRVMGTEWNRDYFLTVLEFIDKTSPVKIGHQVVTTGLDGIFPSGIPIGTVKSITTAKDGIFQAAEVIPRVDMLTVREVLIVTHWEP